MRDGVRGRAIASCHGKARSRARFRYGLVQEPRGWHQSPVSPQLSAPLPLSGCQMLGQAAPAPEANGFSSCRPYIVPESKRG